MYKHIFFDLDRTLWALKKILKVLNELYEKYNLFSYGIEDCNNLLKDISIIMKNYGV